MPKLARLTSHSVVARYAVTKERRGVRLAPDSMDRMKDAALTVCPMPLHGF